MKYPHINAKSKARDKKSPNRAQVARLSVLIIIFFVFLTGSVFSREANRANGMVLIPARNVSFQMGSENGNPDEQPVHSVRFSHDFWMDTTQVTQGEYDTVMKTAYFGYSQPLWGNPYGVGAQYPAYAIEWGDAALFCNARSKRDGLDSVYGYTAISGRPGDGCSLDGLTINFTANGYRLPTEAEWEFACRAGTTTDFFWGKDFNPYPETAADSTEIGNYAVWAGNSWNLSADHANFGIQPVALRTPNRFGLYDMAGNVSEWINDWYYDYSAESQVDPTGPTTETYHFVRGGNWGNLATFLRSANRQFASPDYYIYFVGFRTVLPVSSTDIGTNESLNETPGQWSLEQNYPNPFNPVTTIQLSIPKTAQVSLTVYNALGEKVSVLIRNQLLNAGTHSIHYDAADLGTGIYFYRLQADEFVQVKKMMVLK